MPTDPRTQEFMRGYAEQKGLLAAPSMSAARARDTLESCEQLEADHPSDWNAGVIAALRDWLAEVQRSPREAAQAAYETLVAAGFPMVHPDQIAAEVAADVHRLGLTAGRR